MSGQNVGQSPRGELPSRGPQGAFLGMLQGHSQARCGARDTGRGPRPGLCTAGTRRGLTVTSLTTEPDDSGSGGEASLACHREGSDQESGYKVPHMFGHWLRYWHWLH